LAAVDGTAVRAVSDAPPCAVGEWAGIPDGLAGRLRPPLSGWSGSAPQGERERDPLSGIGLQRRLWWWWESPRGTPGWDKCGAEWSFWLAAGMPTSVWRWAVVDEGRAPGGATGRVRCRPALRTASRRHRLRRRKPFGLGLPSPARCLVSSPRPTPRPVLDGRVPRATPPQRAAHAWTCGGRAAGVSLQAKVGLHVGGGGGGAVGRGQRASAAGGVGR